MTNRYDRPAMTCEDARELLPRLGSLGSEVFGGMQGHLFACDDCAVAFGLVLVRARAKAAGGDPTTASPAQAESDRASSTVGFIWTRHRHKHLPERDRKRLESIRRKCVGVYRSFRSLASGSEGIPVVRRRGGGGGTLSREKSVPAIRLRLLDESWVPLRDAAVGCVPSSGPTLREDGTFSLVVRLTGPAAAEYDGRRALCTWVLDAEDRLSFEGVVVDGIVQFEAEGLPFPETALSPDIGCFEFYLAP